MNITPTEPPRKLSAVAAASVVSWGRDEARGGRVFSGGLARASETAFPGPDPPPKWSVTLRSFAQLARGPVSPPPWWTPRTAFCGNLETWTSPSKSFLEGMNPPEPDDSPALRFTLGLAGWAYAELEGAPPRKMVPGTGCFVVAPSSPRCQLPRESPGWTFAWVGIQNPWMVARVANQVKAIGPLVELEPEQALTRVFLRLVRGAIKKDFRDRFDAELAMWEFVLAYERWVHERCDGPGQGHRLLDDVRAKVMAGLPRAIGVNALAAEYSMSRSHFSHFFRTQTGLTPAHYAVEVRIHEAARLLRETSSPLKSIASACGFANANHFSKVFRRHQHTSPPAYRRAMRSI
jgi:AraC-like DNA-binding protein